MSYESAIKLKKEQVAEYKKKIKSLDDKEKIAQYKKAMGVRTKEIKDLEEAAGLKKPPKKKGLAKSGGVKGGY